ncbi:LytTR family two component transcriptional regulator [Anaerobacterium chartisolvens]|uniref:Stage 0 sporulation protein A homolog n=1 Tax=Anaerobacterium chartisolvens TaxID=1297424 RepID=A0A369AKL2_9FIRM|nr:LytTR family DNA-binding domain-containing protein [Anaerobacterium chartisolvens]RCX09625.1 LytTR family two component transcriptional regulator [Anaerobacterium chartisolvens]
MRLDFAILEDEKDLLRYYKSEIEILLKKNDMEGKVVCATVNPNEFVNFVKSCEVNVCIIDINLNANINGMYIAKEIRKLKIPTEIVFVTGHLQYMKDAFYVRAFDYLEKPVTSEELEKCIKRLNKEMDINSLLKQEVIKIKSGTVVYHIPADDILYIEHFEFKSIVVTNNRRIETYESLTNLAKQLPAGIFKQCHRAVWINVNHIDFVDPNKGIIMLKNGNGCSLGKTYKKEFLHYAI